MVPGATWLGHIHHFQHERLNFLRGMGRVGPLVQTRFLNRPILFACTPELAHELLVDKAASFEKSPGIRLLLRDLAGEGLFTSEGDLWKRQRRLMSPLFHANQLSSYTGTMNLEARRALGRVGRWLRCLSAWATGSRLRRCFNELLQLHRASSCGALVQLGS